MPYVNYCFVCEECVPMKHWYDIYLGTGNVKSMKHEWLSLSEKVVG